ncbi:hypothetical protein D3C87_1529900 [compost metagenome]
MRSYPARLAYGPVWPYPETLSITSLGFTFFRCSHDRFHLFRMPGRKFSTSTSASFNSSFRIRWPSGWCRSSVTDFLFRASTFHQRLSPSTIGPIWRSASPPRGCSILITSAPKSANSVAATGPATIVPISITRTPAKGPLSFVSILLILQSSVSAASPESARSANPGSVQSPLRPHKRDGATPIGRLVNLEADRIVGRIGQA